MDDKSIFFKCMYTHKKINSCNYHVKFMFFLKFNFLVAAIGPPGGC